MNKTILIIIGVVVVLIIVGVGVFMLFRPTSPPPDMVPGGQGSGTSPFPVAGPGTTTPDTLSIKGENGERIQTKDFLKDPKTIEDTVNPGYYYLGYHFVEGEGENIPYVIEYIQATDFFNIALYKEPIGKVRKDAERYMMEHLGLSQSQMCQLKYTVGVPYSVNDFYTSQDLRFSFCPDAVAIPE